MPEHNKWGLFWVAAAVALAGCHGGSSPGQSSKAPVSKLPPPRTATAATTAGQAATAAPSVRPVTQGFAKLTPELAAMARQVEAAPDGSAASALSNRRIHVNARKQIQVYVYVSRVDAETESRLAGAGADVERGVATMKVYQVWASPNALRRISKLSDVARITPPAYGFPK